MINKEIMMRTGEIIYPTYMSKEERGRIRDKYGEERDYAWCACRDDVKLYFRISADLKIYPQAHDYVHMPGCVFASAGKGAVRSNVETGETTVVLKFKPYDFSKPQDTEVTHKSKSEMYSGRDKEDDEGPRAGLRELVRLLSTDAFNERMAVGKSLLSADYFMVALFARMKNMKIDGLSRNLRDYRLDTDGWQFFYQKFNGITEKTSSDGRRSISVNAAGPDGKMFSWFIYEKTYMQEAARFERVYGCTPENMDSGTVMMAGIRYRRTSANGNSYTVIGRFVLFVVSRNGIFARSGAELLNLDSLGMYLKNNPDVRMFFGDYGDPYDVYFIKKGCMKKYIVSKHDKTIFGGHAVMNASMVTDEVCGEVVENFLATEI